MSREGCCRHCGSHGYVVCPRCEREIAERIAGAPERTRRIRAAIAEALR